MKHRRGFALVTAIACVVLIAVVATATLFASGQEARATSSELLDQQAFAYAERAALLSIAAWPCAGCDSMAIGGVIIQKPGADPPLESTVYTTRLDSALILVVSEGRVVIGPHARLTRRVSIIARTSRDSSGITRARQLGAQSWAAVYRM